MSLFVTQGELLQGAIEVFGLYLFTKPYFYRISQNFKPDRFYTAFKVLSSVNLIIYPAENDLQPILASGSKKNKQLFGLV